MPVPLNLEMHEASGWNNPEHFPIFYYREYDESSRTAP